MHKGEGVPTTLLYEPPSSCVRRRRPPVTHGGPRRPLVGSRAPPIPAACPNFLIHATCPTQLCALFHPAGRCCWARQGHGRTGEAGASCWHHLCASGCRMKFYWRSCKSWKFQEAR
ncbi:unnamed protein product [Caretta caretta]